MLLNTSQTTDRKQRTGHVFANNLLRDLFCNKASFYIRFVIPEDDKCSVMYLATYKNSAKHQTKKKKRNKLQALKIIY